MVAVAMIPLCAVGCGGGGGGDVAGETPVGGGGTISETPLSVSHQKAVPGTFITITDDSISGDADLDVVFESASGFEVVLNSTLTEDGSALIPVPPYVDIETGSFEAGDVVVSIANGKKADFRIEDLPEISGLSAGYVVETYLSNQIESLEDALVSLDRFETEYDYSTAELRAEIEERIASIEGWLAELSATGTLSVTSALGGASTLQEADLQIIDRLLYAMLKGNHEQIQQASPGVRLKTLSGAEELDDLFHGGEAVEELLRVISNGSGNFFKSLTAHVAERSGSEEVSLMGDAMQKASQIFLEGFLVDALRTLRGTSYGPGEYTTYQTRKALEDTYDTYTPDMLKRLLSAAYQIDKAINRKWRRLCKEDPSRWYCDSEAVLRGVPSFPFVARHSFKPVEFTSGEPGSLQFYIGGYNSLGPHAQTNQITIEWGDDTSDGPYVKGQQIGSASHAFGPESREHTYYLDADEDEEKQITVTIVGDHDPDGNHKHVLETAVKVKSGVASLGLAYVEEPYPFPLEVNEKGVWKVKLSGGVPPYDVAMDFGDNYTRRKEGTYWTTFIASHAYRAAKEYTITFTATDSTGFLISRQTRVDVGTEWQAPSGDWQNHPNPEHCPAQSTSSDQVQIDLSADSYVKCDYRTGSDNYLYLETIYAGGHKSGWQKTYSKLNGRHYLLIQTPYNSRGERNGVVTYYYDNDTILSETEYRNGDRHGERRVYFRDGTLDVCEIYANDELVGSCMP
jgi:hypothetical protein